MRNLLLTLLTSFSFSLLSAQSVVPLFPKQRVEIKYAMFSPDGNLLAVANARDSLFIMQYPSLKTLKIIKPFTSGSPMSDAFTGRKIFHITGGGDIIYVRKSTEGKEVVVYLRSENIATTQTNFEVKLKSIPASEFDREKLYNRLTYTLKVTGDKILFILNEEIKLFDLETGRPLTEFKVPFAFDAALSVNEEKLAYLTTDSLIVIDAKSAGRVSGSRMEGKCVHFLGDSLIVSGDQITLANPVNPLGGTQIFHHPGFIYGINERSDGKEITFSNSYFTEKGFTASYSRTGRLMSLYHLPKTDGFTSFFHPATNDRYLITTRGILYHFEFNTDPRPLSQAGHRSSIKGLTFSKDRRTLISSASGGEILLWDTHTGRVKERYATNDIGLEGAYFDASGDDIVYSSYGELKKIHRNIPGNVSTAAAYNAFIDPADEPLADAIAAGVTEVRNTATRISGRYKLELKEPFALSGKYIAGFAPDGKLRGIDLSTGRVTDSGVPGVDATFTNALTFYDDEVVVMEGERNTIIFYNLAKNKIVKRLGDVRPHGRKGVNKLLFNAQGDSMLSVINDNEIQLWDLRKAEKIMQLTPASSAVQKYALDFQNGRISFISENNRLYIATVAEIATGKLKMIAYLDEPFHQKTDQVEAVGCKGNGYPMRLSLSPDGTELFILRLFQPSSGSSEVYLDWWDLRKMSLRKSILVSEIGYPCWKVSWPEKMVAIWDYSAMSRKEHAAVAKVQAQAGIVTPPNSFPGIKYFDVMSDTKPKQLDLDRIGISRLGDNSVAEISGGEMWIKDEYSMMMHKVDLTRSAIRQTIDVSRHYHFDRIGAHFTLEGDQLIYAVHPWNEAQSVNIRSWSETKKKVTAETSTAGAPVTEISALNANRTFAIGMNDNTISVRNSESLAEQFRIVQDDQGHYAFITPDQYYKADRAAASALHFSWNNRSFSLHQFDAWFNRPDKVLEASGFTPLEELTLLEKAYSKRKKTKPSIPSIGSLPVVSITNAGEIPFETQADSLEIAIEASGIEVVELRVLTDGVPVKVFRQEPSQLMRARSWVKLLPGKNKISVEAKTEPGMLSLRDELDITYTGAAVKPDLYVYTIAINKYQDPMLTLNYAVKDARDLADFFSRDTRYRKIIVDSLYNADVTRENVLKIAGKLRKARPEDVVILFFAGHGVLDENFDFRFGTWNLDASNPSSTAILYDDIEKLLSNTNSRRKLLLVDACHSGEVDKDEIIETTDQLMRERKGVRGTIKTQNFGKVHHNVFSSGLVDRRGFELMQELFFAPASDNGAQVIVATAGDSFAIESDEWKNGFFTYSILKGLSTLEADLDQDHKITVDEMAGYLKQQVKTMSAGKQVPRFRQENPENYFVVWE